MSDDSVPVQSALAALYRNPRIGDLIIRTSDGVDLHVYRAIIVASSSIFSGILSPPQPPSTSALAARGKPVIDVAESSPVWGTLVTLFYAPRRAAQDDFKNLGEVRAILEAGLKYDMPAATEYAGSALLFPEFMVAAPYSVYALGCAYKLPEVARTAARHTLRLSIYPEYAEELELISFRAYHHLSEYRRRAGEAARTFLRADGRLSHEKSRYLSTIAPLCSRTKACLGTSFLSLSAVYVAKPFVPYLTAVYNEMEFLPDPDIACSKTLMDKAALKTVEKCPSCMHTIHDRLTTASEAIRRGLEKAIAQVEIEIEE